MVADPQGIMWSLHRQQVSEELSVAWDLLREDPQYNRGIMRPHQQPFEDLAKGDQDVDSMLSTAVARVVADCAARVANGPSTVGFAFVTAAITLRDVVRE